MEGKDLTQGNLIANMIKFCIPLFITNLLNSMYNLVDGIWVGRLVGDAGVAAITNCWPITLLASSILSAIAVSASIMVAQKYTSTDKENIKIIITPIYILSILLGLITNIILIFSLDFLLNLLNIPFEIFDISKQYLIIYLIGYIFYFLSFTMLESIRATGNSKVPMILLTLTNIINIVLDPIFILMGLGIAGTALASSVAMIFTLISTTIYINKNSKLLQFNKKFIKIKKDFLKKFFKLSIPMMFAELSTIYTILLEVYISNSLGVTGSSAYGIVSKLQSFLYTLGTSIKSMITIVIAQFIGKKSFNMLHAVMKNGLKIILLPMILISIFIIFYAKWFCSIFTTNKEVIEMAISYLNIVGFAFILIPLYQLEIGFVLGTGNTKFSFITLSISGIVEAILLLLIQSIYNNPLFALGISILAWYIIAIILCLGYYFFYKRKNKTIEVFNTN